MKKSIVYARAVLEEFEKANGGTPIEKILNDNIECHKLNRDLADTYSSLGMSHTYTRYMPIINHQYGGIKKKTNSVLKHLPKIFQFFLTSGMILACNIYKQLFILDFFFLHLQLVLLKINRRILPIFCVNSAMAPNNGLYGLCVLPLYILKNGPRSTKLLKRIIKMIR